MPIYPENFVANALSGTILVNNGFANVALPTNPFALEGDKSFVIRLRKGGTNGLVVATSPAITVRDSSQLVSLTANISTVAEGNLVSFTLVTANAANNSNVFYSIFPVTSNVTTADFVGANVGRATIINNQATFTIFANADVSLVNETGETFRVQLRENSPTGNIIFNTSNVVITDVSRRVNVFNITESAGFVVEGGTVTFTIFAHNISTGGLLYYYTSGNADITGSNSGSIVMNGVSNTVTITTASTIPTSESRLLTLVVSETNFGPALRTSNAITVADPALLYINATGGSVSTAGGFRTHTFTSSDTFVVNSVPAISPGTVEYLVVGGGGGGGGAAFPPPGSSPPAGYPAPIAAVNPTSNQSAGGGGGGGVLLSNVGITSNTYPVIIGAGGGGGNSVTFHHPSNPVPAYSPSIKGGNGSNSSVLGITAYGGGGGGWAGGLPSPAVYTPLFDGSPGGSGGGAGSNAAPVGGGGSAGGVTVPGQGFPGGSANVPAATGGGGGGATEAGQTGSGTPPGKGGNGGRGLFSTISGANVGYGGGGGGGSRNDSVALTPSTGPLGGAGGGGAGGFRTGPGPLPVIFGAGNGSGNQGGGGGGAGKNFGRFDSSTPAGVRDTVTYGGAGGSGIVIIRYPYA